MRDILQTIPFIVRAVIILRFYDPYTRKSEMAEMELQF